MQLMRMYLVNKRQVLDMSIRKTSSVLDMDVHHYRRIEQGHIAQVGFLTFCKIARVLEISLEELLEQELLYQQERSEFNEHVSSCFSKKRDSSVSVC